MELELIRPQIRRYELNEAARVDGAIAAADDDLPANGSPSD
ncbi:hypothetical protein ACWGNU_04880 [Paenibacillus lautus]